MGIFLYSVGYIPIVKERGEVFLSSGITTITHMLRRNEYYSMVIFGAWGLVASQFA
jgi:hypothetical protein